MLAFLPFHRPDDAIPVGAMSVEVAERMRARGHVRLCPHIGRLELREPEITPALEAMRDSLHREGQIGPPRHEAIAVRLTAGGAAVGSVDRSAVRALGLWIFKVHVNGLVPSREGATGIWLSRRSPQAQWNPDRFDTMVAGGVALAQEPADAVRAECWEEAGLPADALASLRTIKRIAIQYVSDRGWHREVLIIHDLPLPEGWQPCCHDGEIAWSRCVDAEALTRLIDTPGEMKFSSAFVCRDLLERLARTGADDALS